ncbi:hypothetical protein P12x_000871 [Tundrisphaera lichenicola]|uniref:hypothetical protein n=1 Tax=Tundrisphaera lichenicola TaxID=2029860 RepID=UPI003EBA942A
MFLVTSSRHFLKTIAPTRPLRQLVEVALVVIVSCLFQALFPIEWVTWESLERVRVGMPRQAVRSLFVRLPDERIIAPGKVVDPRTFEWADRRLRRADLPKGARDYRMDIWESPGLGVVVIYDDEDRVACQLSNTGHVREDRVIGALRSVLRRLW